MLSLLEYFPFRVFGVCLIVFLLGVGREYAPTIEPVRVLTSVSEVERGKAVLKAVVIFNGKIDGQSRLLLSNQSQLLWGKVFTQRKTQPNGNRVGIDSCQIESIIFFSQGKQANVFRLLFMPFIRRGHCCDYRGFNFSGRALTDINEINCQPLLFSQVNVHAVGAKERTLLGFESVPRQIDAITISLQRISHHFQLSDHGFGLGLHLFLLKFHLLKLPLHGPNRFGVLVNQTYRLSQRVSGVSGLAQCADSLSPQSPPLAFDLTESRFHFAELCPIYSGLYQYRDKKQKVKNNKRIRPACGFILILLSAIPGLPGFSGIYTGRWGWSALLLSVSGVLVLCGTQLALSEPKQENYYKHKIKCNTKSLDS
jgi:hypothetical protein